MNNASALGEPVWRHARNVEVAALVAPRLPGIYAYAECDLVYGLPRQRQWIYVGKSRRLDQRLKQHDAGKERHPELRDWLHRHHGSGEVWYAAVDPDHLDQVERDLIKSLEPSLNRVRYRAHEPKS